MAEQDYGIAVDARTNSVRSLRPRNRDQKSVMPDARDIKLADKTDAVLSILRGQTSASAVALRFGVDRAEVERWTDDFLKAGENAIQGNRGVVQNGDNAELHELRAMVRELADELSSLRRSMEDR